MLLLTMRELIGQGKRRPRSIGPLESINFIVKNQSMAREISRIIEEDGVEHPSLNFTFRLQDADMVDSLSTVISSIDEEFVTIYMPDIYVYQRADCSAKTLMSRMYEAKSQAIIATGWSSSDIFSPHSSLKVSPDGELQEVKLGSIFQTGSRSAGRYLAPREILEQAISDLPDRETREKKIEDIFLHILRHGKVCTMNVGRADNVNTAIDLLNANLAALHMEGLPYHVGRCVAFDSDLDHSVISSSSFVQRCSLSCSLVLPKTRVSDIVLHRGIVYGEGQVVAFEKKYQSERTSSRLRTMVKNT